MRLNKTLRGDTIIETMFAFAIFGLVAIINLQLMQKGTQLNQASLELNLVREQINNQANALILANSVFINDLNKRGSVVLNENHLLWNQITQTKTTTQIKPLSSYVSASGNCEPAPAHGFVLDPLTSGDYNQTSLKTQINPAVTYAKLVYQNDDDKNSLISSVGNFIHSEGLWIESIKGDNAAGASSLFYDFVIRACWSSAASQLPSVVETVVRLYVPNM